MRGETGASDERPGRPAPDRSLAAQLAAGYYYQLYTGAFELE